jgi:cellulose synthase/poly-beta-1,6-N-acetylglucosamine synthase-like glycosyltransferase
MPSADPSHLGTLLETLLHLARWPLTVTYALVLVVLCLFGLHRFWMITLYRRHRHDDAMPSARFPEDAMPRVTVQLPMYNEGAVARRIIDAACRLDYPTDRLQIQVLDDSTDGTQNDTLRHVRDWRRRGLDIEHRHRPDRTGYKAGALAAATPHASGELIAIFDADFVPPVGFLRDTVHHFTDPTLGMVQARWEHLNREASLLTRAQAMFLDAHFIIEHLARNRGGAWMHFNGTAGLWRKTCIQDAGGWQHDTLTEDMDLSYRAQLAGWAFRFLPEVVCPAELPPEINAFKSQQHRWTKGSIQVAMKVLPKLLKAPLPRRVKLEAAAHTLCPAAYAAVVLFTLLCFPAVLLNLRWTADGSVVGLLLGLLLLTLGTLSAATFYVTSQKALGRSGWAALLQVPMLMALAIGIAINNAVAVVEALLRHESAFIRTPKYAASSHDGEQPAPRIQAIPSLKKWGLVAEIGVGLLMIEAARQSMNHTTTLVSLPFLLLFAVGYLYVGGTSLAVYLQGWWERRRGGPSLPLTPLSEASAA